MIVGENVAKIVNAVSHHCDSCGADDQGICFDIYDILTEMWVWRQIPLGPTLSFNEKKASEFTP